MNFASLSIFTFTSFPTIPDGVTSLACGVRTHCLPCSRTFWFLQYYCKLFDFNLNILQLLRTTNIGNCFRFVHHVGFGVFRCVFFPQLFFLSFSLQAHDLVV
jgi:hypothetical protein